MIDPGSLGFLAPEDTVTNTRKKYELDNVSTSPGMTLVLFLKIVWAQDQVAPTLLIWKILLPMH